MPEIVFFDNNCIVSIHKHVLFFVKVSVNKLSFYTGYGSQSHKM